MTSLKSAYMNIFNPNYDFDDDAEEEFAHFSTYAIPPQMALWEPWNVLSAFIRWHQRPLQRLRAE